MADHYGSAEILFGQTIKELGTGPQVMGGTKWCVFGAPATITRQFVEDGVRERMTRMQTTRVDLLQFHWNDYQDAGYMVALQHLNDMRKEGLITTLGLCNFDSSHTDAICTSLGEGAIVSNQVQFSLIDIRPLHGMGDVCEKHNVKLLTYGTLCGGFLSDTWLGKPEPEAYSGTLTPSQRKYLDVILKVWGDWDLFQTLLKTLRTVADRHSVSVANVATRWVLDHAFVGAVIIGVRMGLSEHTDDNQRVFSFALTDEDRGLIQSVLEKSKGSRMIALIGDCGAEYR